MQVADVVDIENMKSNKVPEIILEIILLDLGDKTTTLPILGFIRIIKSTICSFSQSLNNSKPKIMSDKYVKTYRVDTNKVFFLLYRFRSVLNVT